jgi:urease accessory protein
MNDLASGWRAGLELGFSRRDGRSVLASRRQHGPLTVQRAFYPEGDGCCHLYLLHPPGGLVGGDVLEISAACRDKAHALLTTPAAGKFYRSAGAWAEQRQTLRIEESAAQEWLPQETIFFDGCRARVQTRVELGQNSRFIGWEINCFGRPASGEGFSSGECRLEWELWRGNQPLFIERSRINQEIQAAPWGLRGHAAAGLLLAYPVTPALRDALREALATQAELWAVTLQQEVLVVRCLAKQAEAIKQVFYRAWETARPVVTGNAAHRPRIWKT